MIKKYKAVVVCAFKIEEEYFVKETECMLFSENGNKVHKKSNGVRYFDTLQEAIEYLNASIEHEKEALAFRIEQKQEEIERRQAILKQYMGDR